MEKQPINKIKQFFHEALLMKMSTRVRFERDKSPRIRNPLSHARRKLPRPVGNF